MLMSWILACIKTIWSKYIASYEGIATLLVVFTISLKLLINREVTTLHFKKMIVSIPSEITFLIIGFLLSALVTMSPPRKIEGIMALIVISFIIIVIQYALERYLDNKLSGKLERKAFLWIFCMYILSIILYGVVIFGGMANGQK